MPTVRPRKPLRPTAIVGGLWLLCVALFLTQYLILLDKAAEDIIVSAIFLVALLMALPGTILLLVDWLRYALPERAAPVAAYALLAAAVYGGIGWLTNQMLAAPITCR